MKLLKEEVGIEFTKKSEKIEILSKTEKILINNLGDAGVEIYSETINTHGDIRRNRLRIKNGRAWIVLQEK